nr:phosphoribosylformylglycinamidine synthase subunit PurS [Saprospiraceae bacterium]
MKKYTAHIRIMPMRELLDPQGKAVAKNISNLGIQGVSDVRIGKSIELYLEAKSEELARENVEKACKKLLANLIMENYEFELEEIQE